MVVFPLPCSFTVLFTSPPGLHSLKISSQSSLLPVFDTFLRAEENKILSDNKCKWNTEQYGRWPQWWGSWIITFFFLESFSVHKIIHATTVKPRAIPTHSYLTQHRVFSITYWFEWSLASLSHSWFRSCTPLLLPIAILINSNGAKGRKSIKS